MGKKYVLFLQMTVLISLISLVIICVSMGTTGWVYASPTPYNISGSDYDSEVNHGLFTGTLTRNLVSTPRNYDLAIACVWGSNACAWSCLSTAAARVAEVEALLAGEAPSFACSISTRTIKSATSTRANDVDITTFVNAGAWLSTIIFLVLLLVVAFLTVILSALNAYKSPAENLLNIQGIYIMNGVAVGLDVLVLLIWGIHYALATQYNIAIRDTLAGEYVTNDASLGYSYWLLMAPGCLHLLNIGLIYLREKLVNSEPAEMKIDVEDSTDGSVVLF